jgi:hypothetical protein
VLTTTKTSKLSIIENAQKPVNGANTETPAAPAAPNETNENAGGVELPNNQAPNGVGDGAPRRLPQLLLVIILP